MPPGFRNRRRLARGLLVFGCLLSGACTKRVTYATAGAYTVVTKSDRTHFFFQPHLEFWYRPSGTRAGRGELLGVCGTPRFVRVQLQLPNDPSCFALAPDGSAVIYLHRPMLAGADRRAKAKAEGLYRHSAEGAERLLYPSGEVGQVRTRREIEPNAMRVTGRPPVFTETGVRCLRYLVLFPTGEEREERECDPPADSVGVGSDSSRPAARAPR
ncbi:MAG: hypothetical protein R2909_11465 [Gemmatimonadales bacterium]